MYPLSKLQIWLLKKIFTKSVVQGFDHKNNITNIYRLLYKAAQDQFTEDNKPTLDHFLNECFQEGLK